MDLGHLSLIFQVIAFSVLFSFSVQTGMQRGIEKEKGGNKWHSNFALIIALEYKYVLLVNRLKQASIPWLVDEIVLLDRLQWVYSSVTEKLHSFLFFWKNILNYT